MCRTILLAAVPFICAFLGGLTAVSLVVPNLVEAQEARVRAEHIAVIDSQGAERFSIATGPGIAASLTLRGPDGGPRILLNSGGPAGRGGTEPRQAVVTIIHPGAAQPAVSIGTLDDGLPRVTLNDAEGRRRVLVALDDDGDPSISLFDAAGNVTWSAP